MMPIDVEFRVRARCWTGGPVRWERVKVGLLDRTVQVWDDVAGHYTVCHGAGPGTHARLVRLAWEVRRGS